MGHRIILAGVLIYFLLRFLEPQLENGSFLYTFQNSWSSNPDESNWSRSTASTNGTFLELLPCMPSKDTRTALNHPCKITQVITMCEKTMALNSVVPVALQKLKFSFSRQYNQTLTLIKSILVSLTLARVRGMSREEEATLRNQVHLELIIISNNEESVRSLEAAVTSWDPQYTRNVHLVFQNAVYLKGYEWMENLYAPCSTLRLLLPQLLPHADSVIYTDTDIIVFQHILELWNELAHFTRLTQVGMVRSRREFNVRPLVQRLGLVRIPAYNSGVMLMNLTRLREDPDWKSWLVKGCQTYEAFLQWADQDIMDVWFHIYPERLRPLPCLWNFVPPFFVNRTLCDPTDAGVGILHGISSHFFKQGRIGLLYKAFEDIQLTPSAKHPFRIREFVQSLKQSLTRTRICQIYEEVHDCANDYFEEAITKKLDNYF